MFMIIVKTIATFVLGFITGIILSELVDRYRKRKIIGVLTIECEKAGPRSFDVEMKECEQPMDEIKVEFDEPAHEGPNYDPWTDEEEENE